MLVAILFISTHTSRVGCDTNRSRPNTNKRDFYSHIPCGMWPRMSAMSSFILPFLLTHPVWDVTRKIFLRKKIWNFYSHIPCGMWPQWQYSTAIWQKFLLTHPVWDVTPPGSHLGLPDTYFYSHIPCGMWHHSYISYLSIQSISTHTSRVGCDQVPEFSRSHRLQFLLTHPVWDVTCIAKPA